ncbi:GFA family protein [Bradyrhizobium sp. BRP14]|nr:GFA family protein [Bradyrhizobium sp. BRP14]
MKTTYKGSCHCGRIRYEVDVDLEAGTSRCNCSYCSKLRYWGASVKPEDFRLMCEESGIGDYQFATMSGHHRFCTTCGVAPYGHGYVEEIGGAFVSINVACLDDVEPAVLAALPIQYMDGLHNNWWNPPAETRYM